MMQNSTPQQMHPNQITANIPDAHNLSCGNLSHLGNESYTTALLIADGWPYFNLYGPTYWAVMLFIIVLGVTGNSLVFLMMSDAKLSFLSYSVFLKWLAVSDSSLLIVRLMMETERVYSLPSLSVINEPLCKSLVCLKMLVMIVSPWLVAGLSLDRYVCVCFPMRRDVLCTKRKATVVCSTILGLSVAFVVPIFTGMKLVEGRCIPDQDIRLYFVFIRLLIMSFLPCVFVVVFNARIIMHVKRSHAFRKRFATSHTDSTSHLERNTTRPLLLVCVMAFVTLMPAAVNEAVSSSLQIVQTDPRALILTKRLWPVFILVYLLNFGQNFYILVGSSATYRQIVARRLAVCSLSRKSAQNMDLKSINRGSSELASDVTALPDFSLSVDPFRQTN